jgi:acyl-CoA thioesterase FadM
MNEYSGTYEVRSSDLDANGHVNYATFIDTAGNVLQNYLDVNMTTQ